jgi:beta-glucosidase
MLSFIGLDYSRIVEPGLYDLMIGSSSEHVVWQQELELTGETRVLGQDWQLTTETLVEQ